MKRHLLGTLLLLVIVIAAASPTFASNRDNPPPLQGWTRSQPYQTDDSPQRHGLLTSGSRFERSSPVIADVDGNPGNGREVVIAGTDGRVYAYRATGQLLWERDVPIKGCANFPLVVGKPSVGNLMGGSTPYVLVGYGPIEDTDRACDGGVVAYRGTDGAQAWNFSQRAFEAQTPEPPEDLLGVLTTPALGDADGNGTLEVAFGGLDRNVYLLNSDGSVRWFYHAADTVWSTPLFMNVDADDPLELIVATDISANPFVIPPTQDGGYLHAFDTAQRNPLRMEFQTGFKWRIPFDQVLYSSPLAADLLSSNPGPEIAIGTGCYFPFPGTDKRGKWIKIFRPSDGTVLQTLNAPACVQSSPAVGDIDEDGALEIVATVSGNTTLGGDGKSDIVAWDPTNPNPKWSTSTGDPNSGMNDPDGGDLQSPVIADIDGNGSLEVLAANFWSVRVLAGKTGTPLTCQNPQCGSQASLFAWYTLKSTPAVGDLNGDGVLEVVIGGSHIFDSAKQGHIYVWTNLDSVINSANGTLPAFSAPWPQFRRDGLANGIFSLPGIRPSARALAFLAEPNSNRAALLGVSSADDTNLDWTAVEVSDSSGVITLSNTSGSSGDRLRVQIDTSGKAVGTYSAEIELRAQGLPSVRIPISVRVANTVNRQNLPLIIR